MTALRQQRNPERGRNAAASSFSGAQRNQFQLPLRLPGITASSRIAQVQS